MPLKGSNTVAVERRMDLASLFCMIGRHGPAVALAVIAMVSVLAGFIIYRTVRGKRRKATADDGDSKSPGAERDASPEETHSAVESTDVSDESSSDVKEDVDVSDLKIRRRRAAAEKKPPTYSPRKSDSQVPDNKHTTSDDTEEKAVAWDSYKVAEMYAEEATPSLQSDTYTEAEMVVEDAVDCHQGETDDAIKDVLEEVHDDDSCWKEPEPISDVNHEEEERVSKAECQEDEDVTTDKDVSEKATRKEEENFQCALNNPVRFEQTPHMGNNGDDSRLQDNKTTNSEESNLEESVIHIDAVPLVCYGKDEEFKRDNPNSIDYSSYSGNTGLSPAEEKKNEGEEAEGEGVDHQLIVEQAEIWSSTSEQDINLPSAQQEQCDHVTDKVMPPIQDGDRDEDGGLAEEVIDEDHSNKLTAVGFDAQLPQFNQQDMEQEENGLLYDDQVKKKMVTSDNFVACSEEYDISGVAPSPALPCLSTPLMVGHHDDDLSGIITDAKAQISGIADVPDLSLDHQEPQREDKIAQSLDKDTDSSVLGPQLPSHETDNQLENNKNGTTMVLAEEHNDQVNNDQVDDPRIQSCYKDQRVQTIRNEALEESSVADAPDIVSCDGENTTPIMAEGFDKASVVADPVTVESVTASVIAEEISCPQLPSICQDQQSYHIENNETFDEKRVDSATDAAACNNASLTALLMSEEISCPDILSLSQDQQSDQSAAPVMAEDINPLICQFHLPSFDQSELRDNDMSSAGVGEESGISSMTVSPDAGNEFDIILENTVLPVMDCDLQSEGQTEAQNSLFADDIGMAVIKEDPAGMVLGLYPSSHSCWTSYESFAANEDVFGHEIEDSYHRAVDQFTVQIADSVSSFTDELEKQKDVKVVEIVEVKEKKAGVCNEKKEKGKAEEKEEDYEKTEISIMEATMDHNEWIMDGNYQAFPWMNLSGQSFTQDHTKTNKLPTEESHCSSAVTDTTCIDTTDIPPSSEVKQASSLLLVDDNTESNKKVVAVQPMPQNVNVTFRIHYFTQSPYQTVAVTGDQQELGNWKAFIPLERAKDGHWATVVSLPAESHVEWKFVVLDKGEVCRWEECGNRLLDTGYGDDLLVHKWWGHL